MPDFSTKRTKAQEAPVPEEPGFDSSIDGVSYQNKQNLGGIEILVQMAESGEIDPKNIDIIDVTDRFLRAIAAQPKENLRQSGKIIFHASVLLRMKAEALLTIKIDYTGGDDFVDFDGEGSPIIYDSYDQAVGKQITLADLQRALVRQTRQKQSRYRKVTLEELVESLREAERMEQRRHELQKHRTRAVIDLEGHHDMQDMDDILDLAHDEDIEDVITRIDQLLAKHMAYAMRLSLLNVIELLGGHGDWVDAFLAVLFLSNIGKINLEQEVFYGPLYLVKNESIPQGLVTTEDLAVQPDVFH